jgi:leucyl/phenylalanyl-tRNA--protein transferase
MIPADPPLLTPQLLLRAYAMGIFPMAQSRDDPVLHWIDPKQRGIIPVDGFRISRSLSRAIGRGDYTVTLNADFAGVLAACADRPETWINRPVAALYTALHHQGHAHSLEVTRDGALIGGVYGVALGSAFFGESMFSRATDASKIALAWLFHRLRAGGFTLFDTQFATPHLTSLGGIAISRNTYRRQLAEAIARPATLFPEGYCPSPSAVRQRSTQTS